MRQYNIEIFDTNMNYVCNSTVDDIKYKDDYLDPEKFNIEVSADDITDVGINYFIHIQNSNEDYIGIINHYEEKSEGILRLAVAELSSLFDLEILINVNDWNYTFEEYIKKWIENLYVLGDTSMALPFEVSISSRTENWSIDYDIENEPDEDEDAPPVEVAFINLFNDVILPAFTSHQIRLDYHVDINRKKILIDIGKNEAPEFVIEAELPNIISKSVTIKKSTNETNKVVIYNEENYYDSVIYYLHPSDEFDTDDVDRITPVSYKLLHAKKETERDEETKEEVVVKTFEEVAYEKAVETFGKNKYTNLIELEVFNDDSQLKPTTLKVGQVVSVISEGKVYKTILTGREINSTTKLIFGTVRLELTKLLKGRG